MLNFDFGAGAMEVGLQAFHNYELQQREFQEAQRKERYDLARYHEMLEYNKPLNQMKRLEEAGLNPHLMYGKGTVGNVSQPATGTKAQIIPGLNFKGALSGLNPLGLIQEFQNIEGNQANINLAKYNAENQRMKNVVLSNTTGQLIQREQERLNKLIAETENVKQRTLYVEQLKETQVAKKIYEQERTRLLKDEGININDAPIWRQMDKRGRAFLKWIDENIIQGTRGTISGNLFMPNQ